MLLFCGASSRVAVLPSRAVRSPASLQTGAQRVTLGGGSHQFSRASSSLISFSTISAISTADVNLVSLLQSEIECCPVNEDPHDDDKDKREGFPFQILDCQGERVIYLTRKYEDENILVQIHPYAPFKDGAEEKQPKGPQDELLTGIPMVVNLSKDDDRLCIEFALNAYIDEIVIDSLSVQQPHTSYPYLGPVFGDLDENLRKAFHRFLEIRGITPTITDFVAYYLANKDSKSVFIGSSKSSLLLTSENSSFLVSKSETFR